MSEPDRRHAYCSWCTHKTWHRLDQHRRLRRNRYQCTDCRKATVPCRYCDHMAREGDRWSDECCAEHDGTIPSFAGLEIVLDDIADYRRLRTRNAPNLVRLGKAALNVGLLLNPVGAGSALLFRSALLLGTASTLGAVAGIWTLVRANALADLLRLGPDHFHVGKVAEGSRHAVIVINGFLSEGHQDPADWLAHRSARFSDATWYHVDWAAATHAQAAIDTVLKTTSTLDPAGFRAAADRAEKAGQALAQVLSQTPGWTFTLAGHSLGARVIVSALAAMAEEREPRIQDVFLLGAAVSHSHAGWTHAASVVRGRIYNAWSRQDDVLNRLYTASHGLQATAIGAGPIGHAHQRVIDLDLSDEVSGHLEWKNRFDRVLDRAGACAS